MYFRLFKGNKTETALLLHLLYLKIYSSENLLTDFPFLSNMFLLWFWELSINVLRGLVLSKLCLLSQILYDLIKYILTMLNNPTTLKHSFEIRWVLAFTSNVMTYAKPHTLMKYAFEIRAAFTNTTEYVMLKFYK